MIENLYLGFRRRLPIVIQSEMSECGLACLSMVAGFHGLHTDLSTLRHSYPVSQKGASLAVILRTAAAMGLGTRPVKLGLEQVRELSLPCVLHWNFNHFVVLSSCDSKGVLIHDPAVGRRQLDWKEVSAAFTGVAVELWPGNEFKPLDNRKPFKMRRLLGRIHGLKPALLQIFVLAIALEIFALLSPLFLQWIVDKVTLAGDRNLLGTLAIGFASVVVLQQAAGSIRGWMLLYFGTTLNVQWRSNVFSHLLQLPVRFFERRHIGDIVSRFGAVNAIQHTLTTAFVEALVDGIVSILTLFVLLLYSPLLCAVTVGAMVLYGVCRAVWYRPLREATEEEIMQEARQHSHFLESIRGIKTVKLFGRIELRRASWQAHLVKQVNAGIRTEKLALFYRAVNGLLFGLQNILVLWLGTGQVIEGQFTVGALMAFHAYKSQFDGRITALIDKALEWKMMTLQGERLSEILDEPAELVRAGVSNRESESLPIGISVEDISFRYSNEDPLILDRVSFSISPGASVALVGASGCGKTTLLNILLGVLKPTSGQVHVDGIPLDQCSLDEIRSKFGTVLQDDVLFAGSIGENICFFDDCPDHEWIRECARKASIDADIMAMPMAYHTLVGDMGSVLSGGQKQRILLARALYKRPQILLLDEATSHLDIRSEQLVNSAIKELHITRLIIAHRPETIASADRVIEIAGGRVIRDLEMAKMG